MSVILETSIGNITVDLYIKERPKCCLNFLKLCKLKKFNFNLFHTVQRNFVAQTGDPTGTGKGGVSVFKYLYGDHACYFEAEIKPRIKHTKLGMLSMVNNGNGKHGSQFLITLVDNADYLDAQNHTVFGEVVEGFDVLQKLNNAFTDKDNKPYKHIRIFHTVVLEDPLPDPEGMQQFILERSPSPSKEQLDDIRIDVDEEIDDERNLNSEEIEEKYKEKEAKANAQILEMVGDLPDADVKPPDNVLFVCKLNPVTTESDLEVIFSRFGPITNCEIIKDYKTQESLQYAFIEFQNVEDCEKAYFKMDNVLIDDRRIHVDFSQSVSKFKWIKKDKEKKEELKMQYEVKNFERKLDNKYDFVFDDTTFENKHQQHSKDNVRKRKHDEESECKEKKHLTSKSGEKEKSHKKHKRTSTRKT